MIVDAILVVLDPVNMMWFMMGSFLGLIAGILPGIGASLTMALLIPVTFFLPVERGLMTLVAAWAAAVYGGSISSILINTPGTGGNVATTLDGFPMTRNGKAKVALGLSATSSMLGGLFGIAVLILFAPKIAAFAIKFGPSEYFLLALFGLAIISTTIKGSALKGLISAGIGLLLSFVGYDIISGYIRYNFKTMYLEDGISFLIVVIGLFAVTQVLEFVSEKGSIARAGKIEGSLIEGILLTFKNWKTVLKSCCIGSLFGFAPGIGTSAASLVAYGEAESSSKHPETFGCGEPQGIIAAEAANNAVQGGALIPALTLGIPGNSDSAVFLAGLMMYGITPGKDLFQGNSSLVTILFISLILAQIAFMVVGLSMTKVFSKITIIPVTILMPCVWIVAATGAYALHNNMMDVLAAIIIGIISFAMRKNKFPIIPLLMAVILGPIAEKNFMRTLMISNNSYSVFFQGWINQLILGMIVFALFFPLISKNKSKILKFIKAGKKINE